jgi:pyruvate formate lyase activating enzyme
MLVSEVSSPSDCISKRAVLSVKNKTNKRMEIYDLTPLTMLDYPEHLACILWFAGCSMRCKYCYNPHIVAANEGNFSIGDIVGFLEKRKGLLDAVVLSGGECTDCHDISDICSKIKSMGFKVKIDTNGSNPGVLREIIEAGVVDCMALDYKAPLHKFRSVTGYDNFARFSESLDILLQFKIPFEVRTTVHTALLNEKDISTIAEDLINRGYNSIYYLQKYIGKTPTLEKMPQQISWIDITKIKTKLTLKIR